MLARLDERLAPGRAAVDREGNHLRIEGSAAEGPSAISEVKALLSEMGYHAESLGSEPPVAERWYSKADVDELSREEARVLAERFISEMTSRAELKDIEPTVARSFVEEALISGFRQAAETGEIDLGSFRAPEDFEGIVPQQRDFLIEWLRRRTEGKGGHD